MRKLLIILLSLLFCQYSLFAADITDNINNYIFGQTVTLDHVVFNFPTNAPVNGYSLRIYGVGTGVTNYYWESAVSISDASAIYWVTNTVVVTNTAEFSIAGLAANKITLHDVRMFLCLTNGAPLTKRATIGLYRNSNYRDDALTYLDTNQLYYSVLTTESGVDGESSNVVADASGSVVNDLYYKAITGTTTTDYQRVQSATATAIIWGCTNLFNSDSNMLISHVNQYGGFPYYDATGSSSMWFRLTFTSGYTGTIQTVVNYGQ
jgi:hypothetical protein